MHTMLESSLGECAVFGVLRTSHRQLPRILMCVHIRVCVAACAPQVIAPPFVRDGATARRMGWRGWRRRLLVVRHVRSVLVGMNAEGGERGDGSAGGDVKVGGGIYFLLAGTAAAAGGHGMYFLLVGTTAEEARMACFSFGGDHGGRGGVGMCFLLAGSTAAEVGSACILFW